MRRETVDIVRELVGKIPKRIVASEIVDNGDNTYTYKTCDTLYAQGTCQEVTIGGERYEVVGVEFCESITLKGDVLPTELEFDLYDVYYFHGVVQDTAEEWIRITDYADKTPMVYLVEPSVEDPNDDVKKSIDRVSKFRMFFIGQSKWEDFTTLDHYDYAIRQMSRLEALFADTLRLSKDIHDYDRSNKMNRAKFARKTKSDSVEAVFDEDLTGCQLNYRVTINKCCKSTTSCRCHW